MLQFLFWLALWRKFFVGCLFSKYELSAIVFIQKKPVKCSSEQDINDFHCDWNFFCFENAHFSHSYFALFSLFRKKKLKYASSFFLYGQQANNYAISL